jgi:CTP:molybdopterin cytidylyltransferase MocA
MPLLCVIMRAMVRGVILAAGASSRMGRPKAALPLSDDADTFARRLVRALLAAGITDIVVVTGAHPREVAAALGPPDARVRLVHNEDWAGGQLTSLRAALAAPSRSGEAAPVEAILVALVDTPLVSSQTITAVVEAWRSTRAPIVRPARGDEHGHPVLFDQSLFQELLQADPAVGAKAVVRAHAAAILNVPIDDPGAYVDVDTEDEYRALRAQLAREPAPPR